MIEKFGVDFIFGVRRCFIRVTVMVGCTGGLLNVIEKVGLVDFIGERSAAGENKGWILLKEGSSSEYEVKEEAVSLSVERLDEVNKEH